MKVRTQLAITVVATGLLTAALVIGAVLYGYQRFERELAYRRSSEFLVRVVARYDNLLELHSQGADDVAQLLRSLVLFEPGVALYLLDDQGRVLAGTGEPPLAAGQRVALGPVQQAAGDAGMPYVMGEDPARGGSNAVVAAQPLKRATIRPAPGVAGYLYLVCPPAPQADGQFAAARAGFGLPALGLIVAIVAVTTLLSAWVIARVTRPLRRLTDAVAALKLTGMGEAPAPLPAALATASRDEFGHLAGAFRMLLDRVHEQWAALRRLDSFRREAVSNLSHDLRSPLTATAACLETLDARWAATATAAPEPASDITADRELLAVARRNTLNAARLVQSLGDLAQLDEPAFALRLQRVDLRELLDGVQLRFAERARSAGVALDSTPAAQPVPAEVDIELIERALANLIDNALKFARNGDHISLEASTASAPAQTGAALPVSLSVTDTGPGINEADLPRLFDRFYQARQSTAPATGEGGKGLGLAIVKRIAELHGGAVDVRSARGSGTRVSLRLPASPAGAADGG